MKRIILIASLLLQFFLSYGQEKKITLVSTEVIYEYCKQNGGDSTLIKYSCSYIGLIDSSTCMYILNSIKGDYSQQPSYDYKKNTISENRYERLYSARRSLVLESSLLIKNQILQDLVYEVLNKDLIESEGGYIWRTRDYEIKSLIAQIENTSSDTLLIDLANKWREKSREYYISEPDLNSFWNTLSSIFRKSYPKKVENYLQCLKNEKTYLQAYNSINPDSSEIINKRISKNDEIIDNKDEILKIRKLSEEYLPSKKIYTLADFNFDEYINKTIIDVDFKVPDYIYLELIYNNKVGIMHESVSYTFSKKRGSSSSVTNYFEIQSDGYVTIKELEATSIN